MKCLGFRLYARDNGDNAFFFLFFCSLRLLKMRSHCLLITVNIFSIDFA